MAKTKISEFSATPGNNTDIDGINIAEGCAPSGINDAIRELMSQLKDFQTGSAGDSFNGPVGTTTAAAGAFTTLSASSTVSGTGFSTYLASPPAIGGTAAAAGSFTTLAASGAFSLSGDQVQVTEGGTGASSASAARTNLGLVIGTDVQAYNANNAVTNTAQTFTVSQRGTVTTDNDLSFDMSVTNNFKCTPTATGALTFTNITAGQSGYVLLVNSGGYAITAAATTKVGATFLSTVSAAGTYLVSYFSDGTNVYVTASGALS